MGGGGGRRDVDEDGDGEDCRGGLDRKLQEFLGDEGGGGFVWSIGPSPQCTIE